MSTITRDNLRAFLLQDPTALADAVINGLSAAGGEPEWDSDTIEAVLYPFYELMKESGMPWVGSTSSAAEAVNAWRRMTPTDWGEICAEHWEDDCYCKDEEEESAA